MVAELIDDIQKNLEHYEKLLYRIESGDRDERIKQLKETLQYIKKEKIINPIIQELEQSLCDFKRLKMCSELLSGISGVSCIGTGLIGGFSILSAPLANAFCVIFAACFVASMVLRGACKNKVYKIESKISELQLSLESLPNSFNVVKNEFDEHKKNDISEYTNLESYVKNKLDKLAKLDAKEIKSKIDGCRRKISSIDQEFGSPIANMNLVGDIKNDDEFEEIDDDFELFLGDKRSNFICKIKNESYRRSDSDTLNSSNKSNLGLPPEKGFLSALEENEVF